MNQHPLNPAVVEINRRNGEFWAEQMESLERLLADDAIRTAAFTIMADEAFRNVPIRHRHCFHAAFETATAQCTMFIAAFARKGGQTKKGDPLQGLIERIVAELPSISERELRKRFYECKDVRDVIQDIGDDMVSFETQGGRLKEAPISGLKDRLSRAKKKLRSR